jgi:hypothetical protein
VPAKYKKMAENSRISMAAGWTFVWKHELLLNLQRMKGGNNPGQSPFLHFYFGTVGFFSANTKKNVRL